MVFILCVWLFGRSNESLTDHKYLQNLGNWRFNLFTEVAPLIITPRYTEIYNFGHESRVYLCSYSYPTPFINSFSFFIHSITLIDFYMVPWTHSNNLFIKFWLFQLWLTLYSKKCPHIKISMTYKKWLLECVYTIKFLYCGI